MRSEAVWSARRCKPAPRNTGYVVQRAGQLARPGRNATSPQARSRSGLLGGEVLCPADSESPFPKKRKKLETRTGEKVLGPAAAPPFFFGGGGGACFRGGRGATAQWLRCKLILFYPRIAATRGCIKKRKSASPH
jgi:hypothetical protein